MTHAAAHQDSYDSIVDKLKVLIAENLDVNVGADAIAADDSLFEDGIGLDSIAIVEFITLIEEHFGCSFEEESLTMDQFKNLNTLAHFIASQQQQHRGTQP